MPWGIRWPVELVPKSRWISRSTAVSLAWQKNMSS